MQKYGAIISPTLRPLYSWTKGTMQKIQGFNKSIIIKLAWINRQEYAKWELAMQLDITYGDENSQDYSVSHSSPYVEFVTLLAQQTIWPYACDYSNISTMHALMNGSRGLCGVEMMEKANNEWWIMEWSQWPIM